jgi:hypothetical protein
MRISDDFQKLDALLTLEAVDEAFKIAEKSHNGKFLAKVRNHAEDRKLFKIRDMCNVKLKELMGIA